MRGKSYRFRLERAVVVIRHYLNVTSEPNYLISYLAFEADNYGYGDKHYGKTECYAYYSNPNHIDNKLPLRAKEKVDFDIDCFIDKLLKEKGEN